MSAKNISSEKMNTAGMSGGKTSESNPVVRKLTKNVKTPTHGKPVGHTYGGKK